MSSSRKSSSSISMYSSTTSNSNTPPEEESPGSDSDSEDELFYDAIEASGTLISRYMNKDRTPASERGDLTLVPCGDSPEFDLAAIVGLGAAGAVGSSSSRHAHSTNKGQPQPPSPTVIEEDQETGTARLKKFEETRRRLHDGTPDEPDQEQDTNQSSSQTSSMDGVYPNRSSRPFKVIEQDSISLSHSARGLALSSSSSTSQPPPQTPTPTNPKPPDIISSCVAVASTSTSSGSSTSAAIKIPDPVPPPSTSRAPAPPALAKSSDSIDIQLVPPVPPPRRKKRSKSPTISIVSAACLDKESPVVSPVGITYGVVTAQDEERTRSKSSGPRVLRRTESLGMDKGFTSGIDSSNKNPNAEGISSSSSNASVLPTATATGGGSLPSQGSSSGGSGSGSANSGFFVRTKTDSGKMLSDLEILKQVTVINLDTGERIPLSSAEDKIPKCINPLSLHIMRLTSEYVGEERSISDDDDSSSKKSSTTSGSIRRRGLKIKKLFNDVKSRAIIKARQLKTRSTGGDTQSLHFDAGSLYDHHEAPMSMPPPQSSSSSSSTEPPTPTAEFKLKFAPKNKGPYDFENLTLVQDLTTQHSGPIWCMKFSNCGRLLATGGQDRMIRVWVLKSQLNYFQDVIKASRVSPTPSMESVPMTGINEDQSIPASTSTWPFVPLSTYSGHTADLLDIAWSKSFFLLSSSMDRTVRLWHISRKECLCCFQHIDFVTAIAFHPRDDRYFLSGSLDGKLRLWNIPDKKVALWNEVPGPNNLITTANFCQNGKFAVVGTYDGRCIFYHTEQLKYHTQIILNKKKLGKITGIEPMPGEDKILVTSNDSRIRLYDLRDLSLTCKFTGIVIRSSQIKGSFSHDGKYIISGSENSFVYIWKSAHDFKQGVGGFGRAARRDRNSYWEGVKAHNAVVTCAIFAPDPDLIIKEMEPPTNYSPLGYVLASADFNGSIKVFISRTKQKCSSLPASAIPAI